MSENPTPLQIATPVQPTLRDTKLALREFRKTGISEQPPSATTLQPLLDHCFRRKVDFNLFWMGSTGRWVLRNARHRAAKHLRWVVRSMRVGSPEEPAFLGAQVGAFRAGLEWTGVVWKLVIVGTPKPWRLNARTLAEAQIEAERILREQFFHAMSYVDTI